MLFRSLRKTSQLGTILQQGEAKAEVEPRDGNCGQGRRFSTEPVEISEGRFSRKLCSFSKAEGGPGSYLQEINETIPNEQAGNTEPTTIVFMMSPAEENTYYLKGTIGDTDIMMLLDTGCSHSVIRWQGHPG